MQYRTLDGARFTASSHAELAEALWHSQFSPPETMQEWMQGSAERAQMWNGAILRTDTPENHVDDLIAFGFLERVE